MVAADGRTVFVIDDMVLLRHPDGSAPVYQGVIIDITERETLQEQLRHVQRVDAIGRLAGGIAHDFNNLLMGIIGYSDFAIEANAAGDPERVHQDIERVRASADRARSLTQQLLAFGRKQVLREQPVNVGSAIAEVEELLRRVIGEDIEVVVDVDPNTGFVNVDPAQFEQLLINLAINSRDAMPGGGTLTITATARDIGGAQNRVRPGRYVAIRVADTGLGMDESTLAQLFEPFFTTKPKGKGTGLGLASAHGFIRQSGGDVRVSSAPNRGTEFEILLPAGAPAATPPDEPVRAIA
jgi:signal transduction histidine kinase